MKTRLLLSTCFFYIVLISYGQYVWMYTNLSEPKSGMGSVSHGNKAYFAGGTNGTAYQTRVEIYDVVSGTWDTTEDLSVPRQYIVGAACGNKIFFAGGMDWHVTFNTVDIYNTQTNEWTVDTLSQSKFDFAAVSYGNKILFAGGVDFPFTVTSLVDIFDTQTGLWSTDTLSQARSGIASAVVGDLAIFAGGILGNVTSTDRVDIYNFTTRTWDTDTLSQARSWASATTVGDKVIIAGGISSVGIPSDRVDIYDKATGAWTTASLFEARGSFGNAATLDGKALFAGGGNWNYGFVEPKDVIDIYNESDNSWTADVLTEPLVDHSVVGVVQGYGGYLIVAGGKNDMDNLTSLVQICDVSVGINSEPAVKSITHVFPNPFSHVTTIEYELKSIEKVTLSIFNHLGQQVALLTDEIQHEGKYQAKWNAEGMPSGIYCYRIQIGGEYGGGKMVLVK